MKGCEIKGGGQEILVMVGQWLKFNNDDLGEIGAGCNKFTWIVVIRTCTITAIYWLSLLISQLLACSYYKWAAHFYSLDVLA